MTAAADSNRSSKRNRAYLPGETLYGDVAEQALKKGWTLIPQERGERRISSRIDGHALRWGEYIDNPPPLDLVHHWANQAPSANGAILMGKASGNVFCFDVDVLDEDLVYAIWRLANEKLGETDFIRRGQAPKIALFYRVEDDGDLPPNRAWRFMNAALDGASEDLLEIQARGKLVTAFGYHHKTDKYFEWYGAQPGVQRSDEVLLVTTEQIEAFIDAVQDLRPFHRNGFSGARVETIEGSSDGVRIPKFALGSISDTWLENPTTGKISDGREAFLWHLSQSIVRSNPALAGTEEGVSSLRATVREQFENNAELSGRWTALHLGREIFDKVGRAARDLNEGRTQAILGPDLGLRRQTAPAAAQPFLILGRRQQVTADFEAIDDGEKSARQLNLDRAAASARAQATIEAALSEAFEAVYAGRAEEVHVIPGPTGSGKTSRAIQMIARDPRTKSDDLLPADSEDRLGPWVFVLPTYNNVAELKSRAEVLGLDPSLPDDELVAQAAARGVHLEGSKELSEARRQAFAAGLRTEIYKGKIAAGCKMEDIVAPLMKAGIRTGQLCKSKKKNLAGQVEEVFCDHYATCPAIQQRQRIKQAHVVFLVQNFLTLAIPEELKQVRGVILDERIFHLVLHGTTFQLDTLNRPRREPKLTRQEKEAGLSPLDLLQSRQDAVEIVIPALQSGKDPGRALLDQKDGMRLVAEAKRVCGSAMSIEQAVYPMMSPTAVRDILDRPTGTELAPEWRFWDVLEDRMKNLQHDDLLRAGANDAELDLRAKGETDARIQYIQHSENSKLIRVSWANPMNWSDKTRVLLDASMDPEITQRLFPNCNIVTHEVDTDLNLRVIFAPDQNWAISGLIPNRDTKPAEMLAMANRIEKLRGFISRAAGLYAHGCILVAMPKALRNVLQRDWQAPYNVDFAHHGAVKGLDFARKHVAVISIGRLEPPTSAIDEQVGAMTYRDVEPERPIDALGTGVDDAGKDIRQVRVKRRVKMRDRDAIVASTEYSGELARRLQQQYREEETRQIIGRVRPIHRADTADAIILGQALPDDVVVDALASFEGMLTDLAFWDLVRRTGGIIDFEAMARRSVTPMTVEEVTAMFERLKDRDEILRRYHRVTSRASSGKEATWYLPAYFSEREQDVLAYAQSCAPNEEIIEIALSDMTVVPAGRAPVDAIAEEVGDAMKQRAAEAAALRPVVETVIKRGELKGGIAGGLVRAGQGALGASVAALGAWAIVSRWQAATEEFPADREETGSAVEPVYDDVMWAVA